MLKNYINAFHILFWIQIWNRICFFKLMLDLNTPNRFRIGCGSMSIKMNPDPNPTWILPICVPYQKGPNGDVLAVCCCTFHPFSSWKNMLLGLDFKKKKIENGHS
eukprot:TRINITY_DN24064_c0_g1_i1.p1 TRINITY_DN24064_c0_g1~~TRINITY_DN24064_c0_g1_i1.p1  ORF type:complete len:105 (+),score=4.08 TRINITY_DN24064_c0_g1_i1:522-836(+)